MRLAFFIAVCATSAHAQPENVFTGSTGIKSWSLPEIYQHPDKPHCAMYVNQFQRPEGNTETWHSVAGDVVFRFFRGPGNEPDQVVVLEVPEGYAVVPYTVKREEHETAEFCLAEFRGT